MSNLDYTPLPPNALQLEQRTWPIFADKEQDLKWLSRELDHERSKSHFELNNLPMRAILWSRATSDYALSLIIHHAATDGGSVPTISRDLMSFYRSEVIGDEVVMEPLEAQYSDYLYWADKHDVLLRQKHGSYLERVSGNDGSFLRLSFWRSGTPALDYSLRSELISLKISPTLVTRLSELASGCKTTIATVYLTVLAIIVMRDLDSSQVQIHGALANRSDLGMDKMVGFFPRTAYWDIAIPTGATLATAIAETTATVRESLLHQCYSKAQEGEILASNLCKNPANFRPLYDFPHIFFDYVPPDFMEKPTPDLEVKPLTFPFCDFSGGIAIRAVNFGELGHEIWLEYSADRWESEGVRKMGEDYEALLRLIDSDSLKLTVQELLTKITYHENQNNIH